MSLTNRPKWNDKHAKAMYLDRFGVNIPKRESVI